MIKTKGFQIEFVGARKESYSESKEILKLKKALYMTIYQEEILL